MWSPKAANSSDVPRCPSRADVDGFVFRRLSQIRETSSSSKCGKENARMLLKGTSHGDDSLRPQKTNRIRFPSPQRGRGVRGEGASTLLDVLPSVPRPRLAIAESARNGRAYTFLNRSSAETGAQGAGNPRSDRITWALLYPTSPVTLPPGWQLPPHRYSPGRCAR